jgi:hypothetical protein
LNELAAVAAAETMFLLLLAAAVLAQTTHLEMMVLQILVEEREE